MTTLPAGNGLMQQLQELGSALDQANHDLQREDQSDASLAEALERCEDLLDRYRRHLLVVLAARKANPSGAHPISTTAPVQP